VLLSTVSCGGGGDAVKGGASSGLDATFTAAMSNPGAETVTLGPGTAADDHVVVKVRVTDTSGPWAALDLIYNPIMVEYALGPGNFLEQGGQHPNHLQRPLRAHRGRRFATGNTGGANAWAPGAGRSGPARHPGRELQRRSRTDLDQQPDSTGQHPRIDWLGGYVTGTDPTP
jgi:hypothetical protein